MTTATVREARRPGRRRRPGGPAAALPWCSEPRSPLSAAGLPPLCSSYRPVVGLADSLVLELRCVVLRQLGQEDPPQPHDAASGRVVATRRTPSNFYITFRSAIDLSSNLASGPRIDTRLRPAGGCARPRWWIGRPRRRCDLRQVHMRRSGRMDARCMTRCTTGTWSPWRLRTTHRPRRGVSLPPASGSADGRRGPRWTDREHHQRPRACAASRCGALLRGQGRSRLHTRTAAIELAEPGITVNAVAPGEIATPMTGKRTRTQPPPHGWGCPSAARDMPRRSRT
jgi:hypothetical protein